MGFCRICKVEYGADKSLKFHRVPKDEITRNKWFEIIGKVVPPSSLVCSKHFSEDDYIFNCNNGQKRKLKANAFPKLDLSVNLDSDSKNLVLSGVQHGCTILLTVHPSSKSKSSEDEHFHEGPNNVFTTNNISTNNNVTSRVNNGTTKRHGSVESDITQTSYTTAGQSEQTGLQAQAMLHTPRYPGDLRPEHFVQEKDFFMLKRYLHQQRILSKRNQKKMSYWHQQVNNVKKLLFNLKEEGLMSSKTLKKIQASLPNINQNGI